MKEVCSEQHCIPSCLSSPVHFSSHHQSFSLRELKCNSGLHEGLGEQSATKLDLQPNPYFPKCSSKQVAGLSTFPPYHDIQLQSHWITPGLQMRHLKGVTCTESTQLEVDEAFTHPEGISPNGHTGLCLQEGRVWACAQEQRSLQQNLGQRFCCRQKQMERRPKTKQRSGKPLRRQQEQQPFPGLRRKPWHQSPGYSSLAWLHFSK